MVVTVVATGFDSNYFENNEQSTSTPESTFEKEKPAAEAKDFALENKSNMWDSIKNEPEPEPASNDDDMDIPPSLRARLKGRKKKD